MTSGGRIVGVIAWTAFRMWQRGRALWRWLLSRSLRWVAEARLRQRAGQWAGAVGSPDGVGWQARRVSPERAMRPEERLRLQHRTFLGKHLGHSGRRPGRV
jgi:hypothetical protein